VYTLLGDGELEEGSNWEASMSAAHYGLDNLVVIVDRNTLQITGRTEDVSQLEPLDEKFRVFGYAVHEVDGNDVAELVRIFDQIPFEKGKPNLILAHTIKGKGISFIEDQASWHHHVPNNEEHIAALTELQVAEEKWQVQYGTR
jgi:transketolase